MIQQEQERIVKDMMFFARLIFSSINSQNSSYGDGYENFGYTANKACCICGGGITLSTLSWWFPISTFCYLFIFSIKPIYSNPPECLQCDNEANRILMNGVCECM